MVATTPHPAKMLERSKGRSHYFGTKGDGHNPRTRTRNGAGEEPREKDDKGPFSGRVAALAVTFPVFGFVF